ncbi:hypothetical protein NQ317_012119 [Molorchus minor]|uniref:Uncharacterized protein n=1 Tax=Molorchus minor TaxID=1323400 RepID=A0ABQ9J800_9CUCU|nr:hypothetical protein NQ317_012119 [Molorchus minor]
MLLVVIILLWIGLCYFLCRSPGRLPLPSISSRVIAKSGDELSEKSLLASKKDELDAASIQWKARVEKSDAEKFSVTGKMGEKIREAVPTINIPPVDNKKRTPQAKRFKLKDVMGITHFIYFYNRTEK